MSVPEQYWRFPTRAAIDSLAARFGLDNAPDTQDWEYQVADPSRLEEFLSALERDELTDDERFTLGEIVMQCFEDLAAKEQRVADLTHWPRFVQSIRIRPHVHLRTLCYWSAEDSPIEDAFHISALVRPLWHQLKP